MGFTSLGKVIRERRKSLGITQPHLADLAGVNVNTLYKLERGISNPTIEVLVKIADVLGMEVTLQIKNKEQSQ
ncbi:MAG TPA: helix-turn-helix transcriptional regulator [Chryseosolibacter sp.]|nr:helix-turn-helix transcriptional regulator [Chryseosolibacter sp.]